MRRGAAPHVEHPGGWGGTRHPVELGEDELVEEPREPGHQLAVTLDVLAARAAGELLGDLPVQLGVVAAEGLVRRAGHLVAHDPGRRADGVHPASLRWRTPAAASEAR